MLNKNLAQTIKPSFQPLPDIPDDMRFEAFQSKIMAKCVHCDYPYSTGGVCPNCGSKDPKGSNAKFNGYVILICIIIIALSQCGK